MTNSVPSTSPLASPQAAIAALALTVPVVPVVPVVASPPTVAELTINQFKQLLPDKVKRSINQQLIDQVTALLSDPDMFENYRDNLLGYTRVMADGRFKIEDYVSAVKYVSHKLKGDSNLEAYIRTFPDRYNGFVARGVQSKDIASYVTSYNKNKLVNLIYEQTLVPDYVLNADIRQKAINQLATLMMTATSEKVQSDSANALLTHLKVPEATKIQLDIGISEGSAIAALRETTLALAAQQRLMLQAGQMNAKEVAESGLLIEQDAD
jgi:hypothetical protein